MFVFEMLFAWIYYFNIIGVNNIMFYVSGLIFHGTDLNVHNVRSTQIIFVRSLIRFKEQGQFNIYIIIIITYSKPNRYIFIDYLYFS